MRDQHLVTAFYAQPWAITLDKLLEVQAILHRHANGEQLTPEAIRAQLGAGPRSATSSTSGAIAVLPLIGVIGHHLGNLMESSGSVDVGRLSRQFGALVANPSISAIVLDVDSPGGTIYGVAEFADQIYAARGQKPIVASITGQAASAAYWITSATDEIVMSQSSYVGSIGVIAAHHDLSKALEHDGIAVSLVSAGKYKTEMSPFSPLSDEARAALQEEVNAAYNLFVRAVAKGRGVSVANVRGGYGEGRVVNAIAAKTLGMVDRIGTLDETIRRYDVGSHAPMKAEDRRRRLALV